MEVREKIIKNLKEFYTNNKLNRDGFNCSNLSNCEAIAKKRKIQYKGAQAHVGKLYGEKIKIVVLSLDSGGGHDYIEERTDTIERVKYSNSKTNMHMKGTIELLRIFFPNDTDENCLKRFSMTNSAKCSAGDSKNKLPTDIYKNCSYFHKKEIEILGADIIISQGKDAYPSSLKPKKLSDYELQEFYNSLNIPNQNIMNAIKPTIDKYCKTVELSKSRVLLIHGPHPSARQGQWQLFRDISLPILKLLIDFRTGQLET